MRPAKETKDLLGTTVVLKVQTVSHFLRYSFRVLSLWLRPGIILWTGKATASFYVSISDSVSLSLSMSLSVSLYQPLSYLEYNENHTAPNIIAKLLLLSFVVVILATPAVVVEVVLEVVVVEVVVVVVVVTVVGVAIGAAEEFYDVIIMRNSLMDVSKMRHRYRKSSLLFDVAIVALNHRLYCDVIWHRSPWERTDRALY